MAIQNDSFIHQSLHFVTADAGYGNMTKNILLVQQKLKGMGSGTREVYVVRPNCGLSEQGRQQLHDTHNGDNKITNRRERDRELENDAKYLKLEEDRVFHTCHLLPRGLASTSDNEAESVIMVGGGSDAFNDRPAILAGLLRNEPMLSTVAKYKLSRKTESICTNAPYTVEVKNFIGM